MLTAEQDSGCSAAAPPSDVEEGVLIGSPPLSPEPAVLPPHAQAVNPPTSSASNSGGGDSAPAPIAPLNTSNLGQSHQSCESDPNVSFYSTKKEKAVWRMIEYGVSSEQGTRKTMEDQHKAMLSTDLFTPRDRTAPRMAMGIPFFGVYDGHGGQQCAEFLRENLHTLILSHPHARQDPQRAIKDGVEEAEKLFMEKCKTERIDSGSTVAVALVVDELLVTGNVGDSEIVLCRNGTAKVLTVKHTLSANESEVDRVKACGGRIFHSRVGHPKFNPMLVSLAVSRAVGDAGFKLEEYTDGKASGLIAEAETSVTELEPDDEFIIIGCDGVWDVLSYQGAVDFCKELIKAGKDTQHVTEQLCQEALKLGSTDNVTALFVSLKCRPNSAGGGRPSSATRPASAASARRGSTFEDASSTPTAHQQVPNASTSASGQTPPLPHA
jgi:integrin-linked kinase-associated serine/threonine phosphatase 2C